ncbi:M48 family metallopeptidase [Chloroflexota bacterium]
MVKTNSIDIDGIGKVLFERSKRAKRVVISVKPFKGVRVAVPYRFSFNRAEQFVLTQTDWIEKQLEKMKRYEEEYDLASGTNDDINKVKAKSMLTERLKYLAGKYGFTYNQLFIRNQRTIWGSCSRKNNISLNMKLVRLPEELIDYVILHELVHTRKKDHSRAFWAEMDMLVGNGKKMASRLRSHSMGYTD